MGDSEYATSRLPEKLRPQTLFRRTDGFFSVLLPGALLIHLLGELIPVMLGIPSSGARRGGMPRARPVGSCTTSSVSRIGVGDQR
jgi:hypothetical protein